MPDGRPTGILSLSVIPVGGLQENEFASDLNLPENTYFCRLAVSYGRQGCILPSMHYPQTKIVLFLSVLAARRIILRVEICPIFL